MILVISTVDRGSLSNEACCELLPYNIITKHSRGKISWFSLFSVE